MKNSGTDHPLRKLRMIGTALCLLLWVFIAADPVAASDLPDSPEECNALFEAIEDAVDRAKVRDAGTFQIRQYPFLRTTRLLEAIKFSVKGQEERAMWSGLLFRQGMMAIEKELTNLPEQAVQDLSARVQKMSGETAPDSRGAREAIIRKARECGEELFIQAGENQGFNDLAAGKVNIPSEYRLERQAIGLYPLFTLPVGTAIANYRRKVKKDYAVPLDDLEPQGVLTSFVPEAVSFQDHQGDKIQTLLAESDNNPLGIPLPDNKQLERLIHYYAPILEQDVTRRYDTPGTVVWKGDRIAINTEKTTVYYFTTHALVQGNPLLQLNYVHWYTRRPGIHLFDIEAGRIHAMTIRITLDRNSKPIMVDVIHNCGCYHFFFPSEKAFKEPRTAILREDAFVPQWLPENQNGSKLVVRIGTQRHWVERLYYTSEPASPDRRYQLLPYDILESLPRETGVHESIFTPKGIVKGDTERPERFFLFSMGIPQIGSMRQRGRQGTALIGERYFDDPRLFQNYFFVR